MRRLILEISVRDLNRLYPEDPIHDLKSMEILHVLRSDHQEGDFIARVEFNKRNVRIEDVLRDRLVEVQLLEHEKGKEKENEVYTYFIKAKLSQAIRGEPGLTAVRGYISLPYEVRNGKVKFTFLGNEKQIRGFIKLFEGTGVRYRVVSLTDAKFPPHSLLSYLTEKQRKALITAYTLGYYDIPKKIGLVQLAERLDLSRSTVDMQLRRAERRLLNHIMNEL